MNTPLVLRSGYHHAPLRQPARLPQHLEFDAVDAVNIGALHGADNPCMAGVVWRGTVIVESIWPTEGFAGVQPGINALTSDEPALPNGGAVFHETALWMRAEADLALAPE